MCVCVCVYVCLCVCACKNFGPPNNLKTIYLIYSKFYSYVQYYTGTLQRHHSHFLIFKIMPGRIFKFFSLHLMNMGKFSNSDIWLR